MSDIFTATYLTRGRAKCLNRERYYIYWNEMSGHWCVGHELIGKLTLGVHYYSNKQSAYKDIEKYYRDKVFDLPKHSDDVIKTEQNRTPRPEQKTEQNRTRNGVEERGCGGEKREKRRGKERKRNGE